MDEAPRRAPTVVVSRRVAPGHEDAFARWNQRIRRTAESFPGHLGSTVQPPDAIHPDEWVIVYRFATREQLDAWLRSPERAEVMAEGAEHVLGEPREQVLALPDSGDPVTAVISVRVRPERADDHRVLMARVFDALGRFEGFRRAELLDPVPGVQDDTVIVVSFDGRAQLEAWLGSSLRQRFLEQLAPMLEGDRTINVVGDFAGWFADPGAPSPRRWKTAVVVLGALFPTSLLLTVARQAVLPDLPLVPAVLLGNALGVAVLTWLLLPPLNARLAGWLRR